MLAADTVAIPVSRVFEFLKKWRGKRRMPYINQTFFVDITEYHWGKGTWLYLTARLNKKIFTEDAGCGRWV
jgi:hypothetical protein